MRRSVLLALAGCLLGCASLEAADKFPYTAYIATDEAEIFSGPGRKYYATERLPQGAEIEVYARDATSGFLAIRPPEACFSWVPAEHVQIGADPAIGQIVVPTHSWIGTVAERVRDHKFQVRLPVGESIAIVGERQVRGADGQEQTWLKIAPPAGEFRWIPARSITTSPPRDADADGESPNDREPEAPELAADEPQQAEEVEAPQRRYAVPAIALRDLRPQDRLDESLEDKLVQRAQFTSGAKTRAKPKPVGDGFVPRKPRKLDAETNTPATVDSIRPRSASPAERMARRDSPSQPVESTPAASVSKLRSGEAISSAEVAQQLQAIDLDLSLMLSKPKETWNLAPLKDRVAELVERGETATDRGDARVLHEKIEQISSVFHVSDTAPTIAEVSGYAAVTKEAADPRYDGQGWLKPVLSRTRHSAPYALVDSEGKPQCFVTPSPGFKIERYVNKQVGVYGRRGVIESLQAPHVLAERVIDLERHLR